jgi:competence protein ComEA
MEKIKFYLEKYKIYIAILLTSVLVLFVLFFVMFNKEEVAKAEEILIEEKNEDKIEIEKIRVDVKGYVEKPGVYEFDSNSRVIDVINKAGGLKKNANTDYINLSKKLVDEMVIIVYSNDEVSRFKEEKKQIIYIEYKCECPDNINDSCITESDTVNTNGVKEETKVDVESNEKNKNDKLVSINTGNKEELMSLPGIGESKAESIIKYRQENGNFKYLEDIMNVSGIGESAYSKIKDYIKL